MPLGTSLCPRGFCIARVQRARTRSSHRAEDEVGPVILLTLYRSTGRRGNDEEVAASADVIHAILAGRVGFMPVRRWSLALFADETDQSHASAEGRHQSDVHLLGVPRLPE